MQLHDLLLETAAARPDAVMVQDHGVSPIVASFGAWMAGCVLVPVPTDDAGSDVVHKLDDSDAAVVIVGRRQFPRILAMLDRLHYLFVMYGATEAAPRLSCLAPEDLPRKWGSIGKPVPNVDLFFADPSGRRLPAGTHGELVARGSNITPGYWKDAAATAQTVRDGLYFTGRTREIIKVKGFRVSPREIEERLTRVHGVADATVVGVEHELFGEAPVALVVKADGATAVLLHRCNSS